MKKVIFIADVFYQQLRSDPNSINKLGGGGEMVNDIIVDHLRNKGHQVVKANASVINLEYIKQNSDAFFIIGNFLHLSAECIKEFYHHDYVIMEHDHKYLKTRDPSPFESNNFIAPENLIINSDFYKNAKAVLCQSKLHSQILSDNLMHHNVINLGCSIWSDVQMEAIEKYTTTNKTKKLGILKSDNPIKGTNQAVQICRQKNIPHELIPPCGFEELMEEMSKFEMILTQPQVIETFCRVLAEARMLNCKVASNSRNGCTSEDWFSKFSGPELIKFIKKERERIFLVFERLVANKTSEKEYFAYSNAIRQLKKENPNSADVTVILNAYRRPYNLEMQIEAIRNQTNPPKQIWLWVNAHEDNTGFNFSNLDVDRIVHNNYNWKFYGRFSLALLADTEYVAIYDDDTVPGERWHANCLNTMRETPGILGSAGVILNSKQYINHIRCGWPTRNEELSRVDLVGHAWFFKREWLQYLWKEKPPTWDNGEDIHFSYSAQKYGGIQTYCPPHPASDFSLHGSIYGNELGIDNKATSTNSAVSHQQFFAERDMVVETSLEKGWNTVNKVKV